MKKTNKQPNLKKVINTAAKEGKLFVVTKTSMLNDYINGSFDNFESDLESISNNEIRSLHKNMQKHFHTAFDEITGNFKTFSEAVLSEAEKRGINVVRERLIRYK